ncbi:MAG: electron transport complex subunit RsxC [Gammaproteobacteria bacterium]|nr:electron transport complex subunit RsxC [Gammaproteobacteria bacterium]
MKITQRKLWQFKGGIHPDDHKALSNTAATTPIALAPRLFIPLQQHIGAITKPVVTIGQRVLKGELIAEAGGHVSAPIHAPTSGTVSAIDLHPIAHPSALKIPAIIIDSDGEERWTLREELSRPLDLNPHEIRQRIKAAGVVGLGGAGFPAHIKLNPGAHTQIETLIINGAECEPYITCDDRLMREKPLEVILGIQIMRRALSARHVLIGIEDNKPEAAIALQQILQQLGEREIEVVVVPTIYPTGGERQLIQVLTGKEVPSQGIPLDIGVVCQNVATAAHSYAALYKGEPLINRIVTVSGESVVRPGNYEVPFGTPLSELIGAAGGVKGGGAATVIVGGPMMGIPVTDLQIAVTKTTNAILVQPPQPYPVAHHPCIRCGACAASCPAQLQPQQLYWHSRSRDFDKVQDEHIFDCIECGCCAWVCPSTIPLVHYFRFAKSEIWGRERDKAAADIARERHEFRQQRIEREKQERAELMQRKKAALAKKKAGDGGDVKESIAAAVERTKAKKAKLASQEATLESETIATPSEAEAKSNP